jgi:hypothetical protein
MGVEQNKLEQGQETKKAKKTQTLNIQSFLPEVAEWSALSQAATHWR